MTRRNILISLAALFAGVLIGLLVLREPTEPLTAEALRRARQCWQDSGIAAYTIQYEMNTDLYEVTVENRIVTAATVNGRPPQTGSLRSYSVEGLFDLLALELENLFDPQGPFAGRIGAIPARVRFHHRYGYPERYIRGAAPGGLGARIEVLRFNTAGAPPTERSPGAPESARTLPIDEGGIAGADGLGHHEGHEDHEGTR